MLMVDPGRKPKRIKAAPSVEQSWRTFRLHLAVALADLAEDEYLVVSYKYKATNYFIQFAAQGAQGMRAEAVSNSYIEPSAQLSSKACQHLLALGWNAPTYVPQPGVAEPPEGSSNFYLDAAPPVPYRTLAALGVETLRQVYRVRYPGELQYTAWADEGMSEGMSIRFPLLRIKRVARDG
jgi:hypothetical protein